MSRSKTKINMNDMLSREYMFYEQISKQDSPHDEHIPPNVAIKCIYKYLNIKSSGNSLLTQFYSYVKISQRI